MDEDAYVAFYIEVQANGHLIAAAPDLLEELKWCFRGAGNMERMAAAIAKAEGRS